MLILVSAGGAFLTLNPGIPGGPGGPGGHRAGHCKEGKHSGLSNANSTAREAGLLQGRGGEVMWVLAANPLNLRDS